DVGFVVGAVGGHRGRGVAGLLGDPADGRGQQGRVGRVALVHAVVDDHTVGVVGDLAFESELDTLGEPALDDGSGVGVVQRGQPAGPRWGLSGQPGTGLVDHGGGAAE